MTETASGDSAPAAPMVPDMAVSPVPVLPVPDMAVSPAPVLPGLDTVVSPVLVLPVPDTAVCLAPVLPVPYTVVCLALALPVPDTVVCPAVAAAPTVPDTVVSPAPVLPNKTACRKADSSNYSCMPFYFSPCSNELLIIDYAFHHLSCIIMCRNYACQTDTVSSSVFVCEY